MASEKKWSIGRSVDVVFGGRKVTLMFVRFLISR